jgi:deazaflavin-dependent oxidoreductase (nitroreductase family)
MRLEVTEKRMANEEFITALSATNEVELTVSGRRSGRAISMPVWFVREDDGLDLVPVRGSDSDWYKNVLRVPTIRLTAGGAQMTARATPITDPTKVAEIVDKFRVKYGAQEVASHYSKQDVAMAVRLS